MSPVSQSGFYAGEAFLLQRVVAAVLQARAAWEGVGLVFFHLCLYRGFLCFMIRHRIWPDKLAVELGVARRALKSLQTSTTKMLVPHAPAAVST
jgi:hypothetical protein